MVGRVRGLYDVYTTCAFFLESVHSYCCPIVSISLVLMFNQGEYSLIPTHCQLGVAQSLGRRIMASLSSKLRT